MLQRPPVVGSDLRIFLAKQGTFLSSSLICKIHYVLVMSIIEKEMSYEAFFGLYHRT